eukprot:jgi/Undpi1/6298/HiC_scaffold_20.g08781.m1
MEEADARLQEVVASLLTEHGGNHEQALRQTFACLHNSGLYEAQSPAEEEQREQQVLAVFRSFPFRAPSAPVANGIDAQVEEAQAPPPNGTLAREPEEAGEVIPVQVDPENVGEDASAQPPGLCLIRARLVPRALRPRISRRETGRELQKQQRRQQRQQQEKGQRWKGLRWLEAPRSRRGGSGGRSGGRRGAVVFPRPGRRERRRKKRGNNSDSSSLREEGKVVACRKGMAPKGVCWPTAVWRKGGGGGGSGSGDPESTRQEDLSGGKGQSSGHPAPLQEMEASARYPQLNGGGIEPTLVDARSGLEETVTMAQAVAAADSSSTPSSSVFAPPVSNGADAAASDASPATPAANAAAASKGAAGAGAAAAVAPATAGVAEPHLKTAGQFVENHANRAESPTGMSTDLQDKLKALKLRRKHRFLVMRIDGTEVVADVVGAPGQGPAELRAALPYSDCRYAVYDQELVTTDGRKTSKLFFFTWLPHNATPHNKVVYSHGKMTVRQRLQGLYDVAASCFADVEVALGLAEEEEEDSDIDF